MTYVPSQRYCAICKAPFLVPANKRTLTTCSTACGAELKRRAARRGKAKQRAQREERVCQTRKS